ncbi:MAG: hypothetical protein GX387_10245 [Clostridium sp.]|nr:hypothetical protein [Clostridium sp.]
MMFNPNKEHMVHSIEEFETKPDCCNSFKEYLLDKFIFVNNTETPEGSNYYNGCYLYPLDYNGDLYQSDGILIKFCPWCGEKIKVLKKRT